MKRTLYSLFAIVGVVVTATAAHAVTTSYTGGTYSQDFDTLPNSGTIPLVWSNDTSLPGWEIYRTPAPGTANTTFGYGTGSSNAGGFNSYGAASTTERALGGLGSGSASGWWAVGLTNNTAAAISDVTLEFDGEQWRNGGATSATPPVAAVPQTMVLEWGIGATFTTVATWTAPGGTFDFTSPVVADVAAAVDGNTAGLVANLGGALTSVGWDVGSTLWIRWIEINNPGNDHGLAVDNFSLTTGGGPGPTINANFDGINGVNGDDFLIWQRGLGIGSGATLADGDSDGNGIVNGVDLTNWKNAYGTPAVGAVTPIPEPATFGLVAVALAGIVAVGRRRS